MGPATKLRDEPLRQGDVLHDANGTSWRYSYTTTSSPPRLCVEPAKGGQIRYVLVDLFPGVTVGDS